MKLRDEKERCKREIRRTNKKKRLKEDQEIKMEKEIENKDKKEE